jgi:hypothetical protein
MPGVIALDVAGRMEFRGESNRRTSCAVDPTASALGRGVGRVTNAPASQPRSAMQAASQRPSDLHDPVAWAVGRQTGIEEGPHVPGNHAQGSRSLCRPHTARQAE